MTERRSDAEPFALTVQETAKLLRVSRNLAYDLLALAARMYATIARNEATSLYELKKRDGVTTA